MIPADRKNQCNLGQLAVDVVIRKKLEVLNEKDKIPQLMKNENSMACRRRLEEIHKGPLSIIMYGAPRHLRIRQHLPLSSTNSNASEKVVVFSACVTELCLPYSRSISACVVLFFEIKINLPGFTSILYIKYHLCNVRQSFQFQPLKTTDAIRLQ